MKILQICHRIPYPAIDGGNIVMMNTALGLIEAGNEVHQFTLNTNKHFIDPNSIPSDLREKLHFQSVNIDTGIKIGGAIKNLFTSESYNIIRFYNRKVEIELEHILKAGDFDIVQLETLFTAPYISCIRKNSKAKIILRAHNVEHIIWERLADTEINPVKKRYLKFLARRLKKYEVEVLQQIDALVPITTVDENTFKIFNFTGPTLTVPMCLDINDYKFDQKNNADMCLFHLGSMDWMPNVEAVEWFLKYCWLRIHSILPNLKLYLAGRSFPENIIAENYPNVICEGRIEDAHAYMATKQIMIVPLHSGSGMRVKIIQGLALGKTIISTTIGAEGIPLKNDENILLADSPDSFIAQIKKCIENPEWCKQIGTRGRKFVEDIYSNAVVGKQLSVFYGLLRK